MTKLETTSVRIEKRYNEVRQTLGWIKPFEGWSLEQDDFLLDLCSELEHARNNVIAKVASIRADLDTLDVKMAFDKPSLNSLGELQNRPAALEAAVGAFDAYQLLLRAFVKRHKTPRLR